jgi:hypothetical protein
MSLSPHAPPTQRPSPLGARNVAAAIAMVAMLLAFINPVPARADGAASTRNIILAAAAVAAGIIIANNVHHKQVAHDTVVGRTADGGVVYADGRVVYPNGDVLYSSNGNGRPCGWGYGGEERCGSRATAYYPRDYNGHDHGNHNGWYKEKHHEHGDGEHGDGEHRGGDHHEGDDHGD